MELIQVLGRFPAITGLCTVVAIMWCYLMLFQSRSGSRSPSSAGRKLPPGPRGWPIVGNLLQMGWYPHRTVAALAKKHGHIVFLRLGQRPTVVIDSIELINQVTKDFDSVFCSRPQSTFTKIVLYGQLDFVMAPFGAHWRHMRRLCVNELLTPKRLQSAAGQRNEENLGVIRNIAEDARLGNVIDMREQLSNLSLNVMCRMLLGKMSSRIHDLKRGVHEAVRILGFMLVQDYLPFLGYWLDRTGIIQDMHKVRVHLDSVLDGVIQEHQDLASGKLPGGKPDDIISTMLDTPGVNGEPQLDHRAIKACISDLLAGTDTSSTISEWAMTEIIRHPEIQQKLQTELDAIVGRDRIVSESDMPNLRYLTSIVKETLRLHPSNCFTVPRLSMEDAELAGYHIPKGSTVLFNLFALGRDGRVWARPLDFDPDRWADSTGSRTGLADDRLYVFGNGRRACPGYLLGTTLVLLSLARLFHGFAWSFPDGVVAADVDMVEAPGFTNARRCKLMAVASPRLAPHLYGAV